MIFVTVGTHEQPFNRLVECIDGLKRDGIIEEDVFRRATVHMNPNIVSGRNYFRIKRCCSW